MISYNESYMFKGKEGMNVLWVWEWFNENAFLTQQEKKFDHKIKDIRIV
jgi:hypothetical protein